MLLQKQEIAKQTEYKMEKGGIRNLLGIRHMNDDDDYRII